MNLKTRFSLIGFGIIIFLIVTPLLVLYARGFVFDWQTRKIVMTGALVVKTDPSKATIFLNNKKQSGLTPNNVQFLAPGDYQIRIEKNGYQPWIKRLGIRAQLVTWVNLNREYVSLFLKTPIVKQSWDVINSSLSQTRDEIVFSDVLQINSINVNNGTVKQLAASGSISVPAIPPIATLSWHDSSQILQMLTTRANFGLTPKQISQIQNLSTNGSHLIAKINSDLYSLDTATPLLIDKNILTFTLDGNDVWYIQDNLLKRYNYQTGTADLINNNIPTVTNGQIIRANNQVYLILDKTLYIINDNLEKIYNNVDTANWDWAANQLLFANAYELLTYDPADNSTNLILRNISPISSAILNWPTGYVFFANDGKIKAIELDGRDNRNEFTVAPALDNFTVSNDGKTLYTFSKTQINQYTIR